MHPPLLLPVLNNYSESHDMHELYEHRFIYNNFKYIIVVYILIYIDNFYYICMFWFEFGIFIYFSYSKKN